MNLTSMRRTAFELVTVTCLGAALAASSVSGATASTRPSRSGLSGSWSGTYGGTFSGTFKLHWTQVASHLRGSITITYEGQSKKTSVTGKVNGSAISFGAVGPAGAISYTGSVSGSSMSGQYKTPAGGGNWSAHKTS
jgi:hypothetical protein